MEIDYIGGDGETIKEFATYDPIKEEEGKINAKNAALLFNVEFIPFYLAVQRDYKLSDLETKIYGFVKFFTGGGKDFFVSNQRIANELGVRSAQTISRAVKNLVLSGLISATNKTTPMGTIRKLRLVENKIAAIPKSQGGLTKKSRGVDQKVNLYIPSNTDQVININLKGKKFFKKENTDLVGFYKKISGFKNNLGREPSPSEYKNILAKYQKKTCNSA
jgi:hypothetical protein